LAWSSFKPPYSRRQRSSTASGVRKQVPELMSVVPPTALPVGTMMGGVPIVATWPASRYRRIVMSRGPAVRSSASCQSPSSRIATRIPPSASSLATGAPPAPDPTTTASTVTSRDDLIVAPRTTRRSGGW